MRAHTRTHTYIYIGLTLSRLCVWQVEAAQELHHTSWREASGAAGTLPQHAQLCEILRKVYQERKQRAAQAAAGWPSHDIATANIV